MPVRKNASRNSSNEMVKVRSRLAITPGRATGKVTSQNVIQGVSPEIERGLFQTAVEALQPDISTNRENGTQISTCPIPTDHSDRPMP